MSKGTIREDQNCLNCHQAVSGRYCSHCGQENTESSQTFHHIFIHFFEDLTHYDNALWRSLYNLLFKPAALTKAYHSGKRLAYLAPIRLYIFISFITFFALSVLPGSEQNQIDSMKRDRNHAIPIPTIQAFHIEEKGVKELTKMGWLSNTDVFALKNILFDTNLINTNEFADKQGTLYDYQSIKKLEDSHSKESKTSLTSSTEFWFLKKWLKVKSENSNEEIFEKFSDSFSHNISKVLFLYMPLFAFILWLFHNKKKYLYFDNAIFTLHYFSFLLLMILVLFCIDEFFPHIGRDPAIYWLHFTLKTAGIAWMICYFFPAHRRFYGEKFTMSFAKSTAIITINLVSVSVITALFALYTYITI